MNTTVDLATALASSAIARAKLAASAAALARARDVAAECQREADRLAGEEAAWIARHSKKLTSWIEGGSHGDRPVAVADAKVVQAQASARANAAAAQEAAARFEAAETEARAALAAAEAAAQNAARAALFAEVRAEFERFRQQASEFAARRERLFAAYLSTGRDALEPREWLELDTLLGSTAELLQIGLPWLEVPIRMLEQTGGGPETRVQEARARINSIVPEWQMRLEELAAGEATPERGEEEEQQHAA